MQRFFIFYIFFLVFCNLIHAQEPFTIKNKQQKDKIKFQFIHNLIIIPVTVNGVSFQFILDSGVNKTILFNLSTRTLNLVQKESEKTILQGLGSGNGVPALKLKKNSIKIGAAETQNQDIYLVQHKNLDFTPKLGIEIHGIIGYDFLKDVVAKINYKRRTITILNPIKYKKKKRAKWECFPLEFYRNKPYINVAVTLNSKKIPVKLLIDSGGSDALWLFKNEKIGITSPKTYFNDFLGYGLNGSVHGKRSKINGLTINSYQLFNVLVSFPNENAISYAKSFTSRNGSLAGEVLKRFHVVLNYPNKTIELRKNSTFNTPFSYNKSGIVLEQHGLRLVSEKKVESFAPKNTLPKYENTEVFNSKKPQYKLSLKPAFTIVELRENSPAKKSGLQINDVLLQINGKNTSKLTLNAIIAFFYKKENTTINLLVDRNGVLKKFRFKLKNRL